MADLKPLRQQKSERAYQRSEQFATHRHRAKLACFWFAILAAIILFGAWILDLISIITLDDNTSEFLTGVVVGIMGAIIASLLASNPDR